MICLTSYTPFQNHMYYIQNTTIKTMNEKHVECLLMKNSVEMLTDFFMVLSDGYNPALIYVTVTLDRNLDEREYFVLPKHLGGNNQQENRRHFEYINETKTPVSSVSKRIIENFQWCLDHLIICNQAPALFQSKYHMDNLNTVIQKVQNQILYIVEDWQATTHEYYICNEQRFLCIQGQGKSLMLNFGCYIH